MYQQGDCPESRPEVVWPYGTHCNKQEGGHEISADPFTWTIAMVAWWLWWHAEKDKQVHTGRTAGKNVSLAEAILQPSTCIIDGMSLVHNVHGNNKTFT